MGLMVKLTDFEIDPSFAEIVAGLAAVTPFVVIVKVALVEPAAIETVAGTTAWVLLDFNAMLVALPGADVKLTVPVTAVPPVTDVEFRANEPRTGTETVISCGKVTPPYDALTTAEPDPEADGLPVTVNVADVEPAGTVTVNGTVTADVFDELSVTESPPNGAALDRVTVPVVVPPGEIADGVTVQSVSEATGEV